MDSTETTKEVPPSPTQFQPKNKLILIEAIDDPLAPKDDPKKIKIIRRGMSSCCGVVVAAAADCAEWVKPGAVVYHDKAQAAGILLEEGKLYGLVHEELLLGVVPPGLVNIVTHEVFPTAEDVEARRLEMQRGREGGGGGLVVPNGVARRR